MFTNWLNSTYVILIICSFNFCWEYCSPSYNHFTNNYIFFFFFFFDINITLLSCQPFCFKTCATNSFFNVSNPNSLFWLSSSPLIRWSWLISCCCYCPRCLTFLFCYYSRYHFRSCHHFYLLQ